MYAITNNYWQKLGKGGIKYVYLALIVGFMVFAVQIQEQREKKQKAAQAQIEQMAALKKQKNIDYFNKNSVKILSDVKAALENKEYKKVKKLSSKYIPANNKELAELLKKANAGLARIETKKTLAILKSTPSSNYEKNKVLTKDLFITIQT